MDEEHPKTKAWARASDDLVKKKDERRVHHLDVSTLRASACAYACFYIADHHVQSDPSYQPAKCSSGSARSGSAKSEGR